MQRPGANPDDVQMCDILCDFCHREWVEGLPMVEGHRGSVICGRCLEHAYRALVLAGQPTAPEGYQCLMCLEHRPDPGWRSPEFPEAAICARCARQSAGVLTKDKDSGWRRPSG